jgi:hypothetical protein
VPIRPVQIPDCGADGGIPDVLLELTDADAIELAVRFGQDVRSAIDSDAPNWEDYRERMGYIFTFLRAFQQDPEVFDLPPIVVIDLTAVEASRQALPDVGRTGGRSSLSPCHEAVDELPGRDSSEHRPGMVDFVRDYGAAPVHTAVSVTASAPTSRSVVFLNVTRQPALVGRLSEMTSLSNSVVVAPAVSIAPLAHVVE